MSMIEDKRYMYYFDPPEPTPRSNDEEGIKQHMRMMARIRSDRKKQHARIGNMAAYDYLLNTKGMTEADAMARSFRSTAGVLSIENAMVT